MPPGGLLLEARWAGRSDDLHTCAERLATCLAGLAGLDPLFAEWFQTVYEIDADVASLREQLEHQAEARRPAGWILQLWNGVEDDRATAVLTVSCGAAPGADDDLELVLPAAADVRASWMLQFAPERYVRTGALPAGVRELAPGRFLLAPTLAELRPETIERFREAVSLR